MRPRPWSSRAGDRVVDEAAARRLVAPVAEGGEGLHQAAAARRLGCSPTTVWYALHPEARLRRETLRHYSHRRKAIAELETACEYHLQRLIHHQTLLGELRAELARRTPTRPPRLRVTGPGNGAGLLGGGP